MRLRFKLSTFLLFIGVICCWLGFVSVRARIQQGAVKAIRANRGDVYYAHPSRATWLRTFIGDDYLDSVADVVWEDHNEIVSVDDGGASESSPAPRLQYPGGPTDHDLEYVADLRGLRGLDIAFSRVSVAGLRHLAKLTSLESLNLSGIKAVSGNVDFIESVTTLRWLSLRGTCLSDEAIPGLCRFTALENLDLGNTLIGDKELSCFSRLSRLSTLSLDGTMITDAGAAKIAQLTGLTFLSLSDTAISDSGLAKLTALRALSDLHLERTSVSVIASKRLKRAIPRCRVHLR